MFTFSKAGQQASSAKELKTPSEDLIKKIENCVNFSRSYFSQKKPGEDISDGKIDSVIFKVSENTSNATVEYEFWCKESGGHTHYLITLKNKEVVDIVDAAGYTIPCKSFRINEENEAEIVLYSAPRR